MNQLKQQQQFPVAPLQSQDPWAPVSSNDNNQVSKKVLKNRSIC